MHEALDELEALRELLADLLRARRAHLLLQLLLVARRGRSARAASRTASAPMPATKVSSPYWSSASRYSVSVRSWLRLERGLARIDDDVVLVIDDALELSGCVMSSIRPMRDGMHL